MRGARGIHDGVPKLSNWVRSLLVARPRQPGGHGLWSLTPTVEDEWMRQSFSWRSGARAGAGQGVGVHDFLSGRVSEAPGMPTALYPPPSCSRGVQRGQQPIKGGQASSWHPDVHASVRSKPHRYRRSSRANQAFGCSCGGWFGHETRQITRDIPWDIPWGIPWDRHTAQEGRHAGESTVAWMQ